MLTNDPKGVLAKHYIFLRTIARYQYYSNVAVRCICGKQSRRFLLLHQAILAVIAT